MRQPLSHALLGGACFLSGCVSARQPKAPDVPVAVVDRASIERAILAAKAEFDSAARTGDVQNMAEHLVPDVEIVTTSRDTVRSRESVARYLAAQAVDSTTARVEFLTLQTEMCTDGAYEYGGYYTVTKRTPRDSTRQEGRYALRWVADSAGRVHVRQAVFDRTLAMRRPGRGECVQGFRPAYASRRFSVSLMPVLLGGRSWRTTSSMENSLRGRGWGNSMSTRSASGSDFELLSINPHPDVSETSVGAALVGRYRIAGPIQAELVAGLRPKEATVQGLRQATWSLVTIDYSGTEVGSAISYDLRGMRLAAGPVMVRSDYRVTEERIIPPSPGSPIQTYRRQTVDVAESKKQEFGILAGATYVLPVAARFSAELRAHGRWVGKGETPATDGYPSMTVDNGGYTVGIGFGVAF